MNGRIYDPLLGEFVSADPFIQAPSNAQNYNRYSYVLNNPLSLSDPSGFFFGSLFRTLKKAFKTVVQIIPTLVAPILGPILYGVKTGDWGGALLQAGILVASAVISAGIGSYFNSFYTASQLASGSLRTGIELARATVHGIAQGGLTELAGGEFKSGFLAGLTGSLAGSAMGTASGQKMFGRPSDFSNGQWMMRTAAAATVGGTVSELSGGDFANGAMTGAFVHLFNHEMPPYIEGIYDQNMDLWYDSYVDGATLGEEVPWNENNPHFRSGGLPETSDINFPLKKPKMGVFLSTPNEIGGWVPETNQPIFTINIVAADGSVIDVLYGMRFTSARRSDMIPDVDFKYSVSGVQNGIIRKTPWFHVDNITGSGISHLGVPHRFTEHELIRTTGISTISPYAVDFRTAHRPNKIP